MKGKLVACTSFSCNIPEFLTQPQPGTMTAHHSEDVKRLNRAAHVLKTIAHPLRVQIIQLLHENSELNVSAIYQWLNLRQALISHHLTKMRDKGILDFRREGKHIYYFLIDAAVADVIDQLDRSMHLDLPVN